MNFSTMRTRNGSWPFGANNKSETIMETILVSFISAAGALILVVKTIGLKNAVRFQVLIDLILTIGFPILLFGTYSGMVVAFLSGLWVSLFLYAAGKIRLYHNAFSKAT